jgi:hypothetical protein
MKLKRNEGKCQKTLKRSEGKFENSLEISMTDFVDLRIDHN